MLSEIRVQQMSDYLPEEILIGILVKLPVKSLIRATSVCKQWRSLIRSPSFISAHLSTAENQALLRRHSYRDDREHYTVFPKGGPFGICKSSPELEFPFKCSIGCYFRIVGSCNGLVCLSDSRRIILWNPAIRNHLVLPQPLVNHRELNCVDGLEFGARSVRSVLGFGVASNVYKVVRLASCHITGHCCFIPEVFSVGTGMWRKLSGFGVWVRPDFSSIFFKGFVHWIAYGPMSENSCCTSILAFHVGDEVSSRIMLPKELGRHSEASLKIAVRGESLGLFNWSREGGDLIWDVWMMTDYGVEGSWTKLYTIDSLRFERAIGFWGSGEVLFCFNGFELVTYNVESKEIEHVWNSCMRASLYINDYKESLVLLGGGYSGDSEEELNRRAFEGLIQGVEKLVVE